jgi:hypothetical protein
MKIPAHYAVVLVTLVALLTSQTLGGNPDSTVFVDAYDKPFDATIPYDATFFELLDRFV